MAQRKALVVVESPAKAKTINKYLGGDFIVEASLGHVKDLPRGGLSIDVENGFVPTYEVISGKKDVVRRLKALASRCDRIFLATDPDREGEAIAYHVAQEIAPGNGTIQRVLFNEITRSGVASAMRAPRDIDMALVQAQEARRVMDRLIGYQVSPFLWRTFVSRKNGLSAGRVQSVALRLVVEREKEINSFIPIEYWNLNGHFRTPRGQEVVARLVRYDGIDLKNPAGSAVGPDGKPRVAENERTWIATKQEAEAIRDRALQQEYAIVDIRRREVKRNAPAPFTTSTLQQDAFRRLKIPGKKAMKLAQKLYEGVDAGGKRGLVGLITYMRTDSVRISDEAAAAAADVIYEHFGKEYLPKTLKQHKARGKNVQDAHEAIRPTDVRLTPKEARRFLDADLASMYELIWRRFVASQMHEAVFDQTTLEIEGGGFLFRTTGRITRFRGWLQVYGDMEEEKRSAGKGKKGSRSEDDDDDEKGGFDKALPEGLRKGERMDLTKLVPKQSYTKPPPRYTESSLVKEMEARGIGRPSTYAAIIATIQEREYVEQKERKMHATELGVMVSDSLTSNFPKLFDVAFTARMEKDLDTIASGNAPYIQVMQRFYKPFRSSLKSAQLGPGQNEAEKKESTRRRSLKAASESKKSQGKATEVRCEKCDSPMELRKGNYGPYLACTGFPACRNTVSATEDGKPRTQSARQPKETGVTCETCGAPMVRRKGKAGEFYGCSRYPECRSTRVIPLDIACPLCGQGHIAERPGRYQSIFYGCTRYPECRFTSSLKPVNRACPHCSNRWITEAWSNEEGRFLECPNCRRKIEEAG